MGEITKVPWWHALWQGFAAPLRRAEEEAENFRASAAPGPDYKTVAVLVMTATALTLQRYVVLPDVGRFVLGLLDWAVPGTSTTELEHHLENWGDPALRQLAGWVVVCVATYVVLPACLLRYGFRERLRDYGLKLGGAVAGWLLYVGMFTVMVPLVTWMSTSERFQETYPFYPVPPGQSLWPWFWCWEVLYAIQFVALEFFFRGFLLHGLRPRFGAYAIPVMMVPYCMIHFTKPMPEACASIVAGLVLGYMSLKTRSIWLGAALHVTVALSMDFAVLWRQGRLG
jgi:membrane protease YdiL (CAAX protease family)